MNPHQARRNAIVALMPFFPFKGCDCHFTEPYGFVPEAGCPEHDTMQFALLVKINEHLSAMNHKELTDLLEFIET